MPCTTSPSDPSRTMRNRERVWVTTRSDAPARCAVARSARADRAWSDPSDRRRSPCGRRTPRRSPARVPIRRCSRSPCSARPAAAPRAAARPSTREIGRRSRRSGVTRRARPGRAASRIGRPGPFSRLTESSSLTATTSRSASARSRRDSERGPREAGRSSRWPAQSSVPRRGRRRHPR